MSQLENPLLNIPFQKRRGGQGVNPGRQVAPNAPAQISVTPGLSSVNELNQIAASIGALGGAVRAGVNLATEIQDDRKRTQEGQAEQTFREDAQRFASQVEAGDIEFDLLSPEEQEAEADRLIADRTAGMNPTQAEYYRNRAKPWLLGQIGEQVSVVRDAAVEEQRQALLSRAFTIDSPERWGEMRDEFAGNDAEWLRGVVVPALEDAATTGDTRRFEWAQKQLGDRFPEEQRVAGALLEEQVQQAQRQQLRALRDNVVGTVFSDGPEAAYNRVQQLHDQGVIGNEQRVDFENTIGDAVRDGRTAAAAQIRGTRLAGEATALADAVANKDNAAITALTSQTTTFDGERDITPSERIQTAMQTAMANAQTPVEQLEIAGEFSQRIGARAVPGFITAQSSTISGGFDSAMGGDAEEADRIAGLARNYDAMVRSGYTVMAKAMAGDEEQATMLRSVADLMRIDGNLSSSQAVSMVAQARERRRTMDPTAHSQIMSEAFDASDRLMQGRIFARLFGQTGGQGTTDIKFSPDLRRTIMGLTKLEMEFGHLTGKSADEAAEAVADRMRDNVIIVNGIATLLPDGAPRSPDLIETLTEYGKPVVENFLEAAGLTETYAPEDTTMAVDANGMVVMFETNDYGTQRVVGFDPLTPTEFSERFSEVLTASRPEPVEPPKTPVAQVVSDIERFQNEPELLDRLLRRNQ